MSISSILFSRDRKPSVFESISRPDEILQDSLAIVGGTVFVHGGLQIDAKLKNVTVQSLDGKPIVVTALGKMEECCIKGQDVLICGDFTGEVQARGDVEVTNTARIAGSVRAAGHVLVSPMAMEGADVTIGRLAPESAQDAGAVEVLSEEGSDGSNGTDHRSGGENLNQS